MIEHVHRPGNLAIDSDKSLFHFVTSLGPFNFIEDENSASSSSTVLSPSTSSVLMSSLKESSIANTSATASTLGKRKRREEKTTVGKAAVEIFNGLLVANDFASSSVRDESFGCDSTSVDMVSFLEEVDEVLEASITSQKKRRLAGEGVPYQSMGSSDSLLEGSEEGSDDVWRELVLSR